MFYRSQRRRRGRQTAPFSMVMLRPLKMDMSRVGYLKCTSSSSIFTPPSVSGIVLRDRDTVPVASLSDAEDAVGRCRGLSSVGAKAKPLAG